MHVLSGKTLTINTSGTNNRHTLRNGDFINPTSLTCASNSLFLLDGGATVALEGDDTHFQVNDGATLSLEPYGATFVVRNGAVLDLQRGATLNLGFFTGIRVEHGGSLVIRNGANVLGVGGIEVQDGGYLCIEAGVALPTAPYFSLNVAPNAVLGKNPYLGISLGTLDCTGQLQFCGRLTGGNPGLSAICPTAYEALLFDGKDDRVTIPVATSGPAALIHNLAQTFTIEAAIRSDNTVGAYISQPIFSNRTVNAANQYSGMLFTVYNGNNLLFQLNDHNYFDEKDTSMKIGNGCHQVAVSRDANDQLHFYVDGQLAKYAPFVAGTPHTNGPVFIGGDFGYLAPESFMGQIGEVRVWDSTRSDAEISQYNSAAIAAPQANLVGYFDFRDPMGQIVSDASLITYGTSSAAPNGYLGDTPNVDNSDPTQVLGRDLTCTVAGNFRSLPGPKSSPAGQSLLDTLGRAQRRPLVTAQATAARHLSQLTLAPNPASGEATLHFQLRDAGKLEVQLQDLMGQARATALPPTTLEAGAHDVKLPLQKLSPGLYLVIVTSADGREVMRLDVK